MRVFLDANILFSAALGGENFELLWSIEKTGKCLLVTSRFCILEAVDNIQRKRPDSESNLRKKLSSVGKVPESPERFEWASKLVPEKDVPVLAAAVGCSSHVLLTGDVTDFGSLMKRDDLPLQVRTLRAFLLQGPRF